MPDELDLTSDPVRLTTVICDVESVSRNEERLADLVEAALRRVGHLEVTRLGNNVVARTELGRGDRVVVAGHLDTVPLNDNLPVRDDGTYLHGLGTCDMKGGVAIALHLAATLAEPVRDVTYVFYECEEIEATANGLGRLARERPELLEADFAILMEPSDARVEAGCQGTLRVEARTRGERAHSARAWRGHNAIHDAAEILTRLRDYEPRRVLIDGLEYREGLNAVLITGGVATNVVPDECVVTVNYRFAPDRGEEEALAHVQEVLDGFELTLTDTSPGALPGLERPAAAAFVDAVGGQVGPKFGWTDVSRFSALGVPAVNYGPGDSMYAHKQDEHVPIAQIRDVAAVLRTWLSS